MASETITKTIGVVVAICFVAAIFVSSAAVGLKPIQEENKKLDLLKNILIAGDLYNEDTENIAQTFNSNVDAEIISLADGEVVPKENYDDVLNLGDFNVKDVAGSDLHGRAIEPANDIAGIQRMPKKMAIYKVKGESGYDKYIFPIYGKGLWSTLYGFIALDKDLHTIKGFTFYEHGETPGLGGEVDNPRWKKQWVGKQAYDEDWILQIEIIKGLTDPNSSKYKYQVDGLSGSTITTRGVSNLVRFWLSDVGYKPLIDKLRKEM